MDYATFKTYLATFLWKQNDTDLVNNLDSLILMANSEMSRRLDIQRREITALIAPETNDYVLPADFRQMISLTGLTDTRPSIYNSTTALDVYTKRTQNSECYYAVYAIAQEGSTKILRLAGPYSSTAPGSFALVYRANIPDFATLDESWLADDFLDLYTYAVLSHTAPFLREDERVAMWLKFKDDAVIQTIDEDRHNVVFGGSPLEMKPHHPVP